MTILYHWTREASATRILTEGFRNSTYDSFDGCGQCLGVYVCTGRARHEPGNRALLAIDVPPSVIASAPSSACPPADTDYVIPAAILNGLSVSRIA